MRILMLNYEYPPLGGGASPVTQEMCSELVKLGYKIDVVTMSYKGLKKKQKHGGLTVYRVPCVRTKKESANFVEMLSFILPAYYKCIELLNKFKYDLIHAHFILPTGFIAYLLNKKFGIKYIITSHGSDVPGYNPDRFIFLHKILHPFWRMVIRNATYITTPSKHLKKLILKSITLDNIIPVPNGIYFTKYKKKQKENIILYAGRLFKRKGVQYLLKACDNLPNKWRVIIVGDGNYKNDLIRLSQKISARIEFTGWLPKKKLFDIYKKSSIFVLPSTEESFGMVIAEAMMFSNAVITTKGIACEEVVGDAGLLVKKKNYKEIREKIDFLIKDKNLLKKYKAKAKKHSTKYSWNNVIKKFIYIYNTI